VTDREQSAAEIEAQEVMRQSARQAAGFFAASLVFAVCVGGLLGMLLLATLSVGGNWLAGLGADAARRAHAYAQLFGFAALYVMGVALHVLPRLTGRPLQQAGLVRWAFVAAAVGSGVAVAAALADVDSVLVWASAHVLLTFGGAVFFLIVATQLRGAALPPPMVPYLLAGSFWLVAAASLPLLPGTGSLVSGTVRAAVWEAMLWGFAANWIYGMSLRILPAALGAAWQPREMDRWVWLAHQVGVVAWVGAHALAPYGWWAGTARMWAFAGGLVIAAAGLSFVQRLGVFSRTRAPVAHPLPGTEKFLYAAYAWLLVAVIEGPLWSAGHAAAGTPYGGAALDFARHAFTLGFLTQMIFGVSMRVIPMAAGLPLWSERWRDASFWLLNGGTLVRACEVVAFARGLAWLYPWSALSGVLAWLAFATFAVNVVLTLRGRPERG